MCLRAEIASGQVGHHIGTHARAAGGRRLSQPMVKWSTTTPGLASRDQLRHAPPVHSHLLVAATSIRTVARTARRRPETLLRELPLGRQPIATNVIFAGRQARLADRASAAHHRAMLPPAARSVAPVSRVRRHRRVQGVRPSATAEGLFSGCARRASQSCGLALMHGRLSADDSDAAVMAVFRAGEVDVLVHHGH